MDRLIQCGRELGLEGKELHQFIEAQQIIERDERAESRRVELAKLEFKVAIEKEKKEILEKERLKIQAVLELKNEGVDTSMNFQGIEGRQRAKGPKLPTFVDGKDDLDSYLKRFERFAISNGWEKHEWATALSALLTGKALDVYSRLPDDTALDYEKVKEALLIRYQLTEEGFKKRYRESDPEEGETPDQFYVRIDGYLDRWVELSGTEKSYQGLKELINKEQFISRCPQDLAIYLKEVAPQDHDEMTKNAQQYLSAHGKQLARKRNRVGHNSESSSSPGQANIKAKDYGEFKCFICHQKGHKAFECDSMKKAERKCYNCGGLNHEAKDCPFPGQGRKKPPTKAAASLSIKQELVDKENTELEAAATQADIESCIVGDELTIGCGKRIPIIKSACIKPTEGSEDSMPVVTGRVGNKSVSVLRDTGCSGVVIKRDLVTEEELTGRFGYMLLIDRTIRKVPIARVFIDTPYFTGEAEAQCLPDAMYDVIIGNIPNARGPEDPDASWEIACAVTRAQAKKGQGIPPLKVPDATKCATVTREQLIK